MTPYKDAIFCELKKVLARAEPEQIESLLSDIAKGKFTETSLTRAGANDDHSNVTDITELGNQRRIAAAHAHDRVQNRAARDHSVQLSAAARDVRRAGYSS